MTQNILFTMVLLLSIKLIGATQPQKTDEETDKPLKAAAATMAEMVAAARTCNTYVHFKKGDDAHCLYDPVAENAVAITVFHNRKIDEVKLCIPGKDKVLVDSAVHDFKIDDVDYYAIHKHEKLIIANTVTGQTGVINLATPKAK